ncbi:hypothetical protein AU14_16520 [Marinobacter similis]|uniref:Uncharacterized protein n=1 Tax=Marinobacter similis TaxID=1420916 RepID=W5YUR7_9GAMM|nr:hypothetical protein AU14_16520 [Marinobacter similis]
MKTRPTDLVDHYQRAFQRGQPSIWQRLKMDLFKIFQSEYYEKLTINWVISLSSMNYQIFAH